MPVRIEVVGGGAIGLSLAARLALAGTPVRIWTRTGAQAELLRRQGIAYRDGAAARIAHVEAEATGEAPLAEAAAATAAASRAGEAEARWIALAVKQTHLDKPELPRFVAALAGGDPVLCLQNGIGHIDKLRRHAPALRLVAAVTFEGALREDGRTVVRTGAGELHMAEADVGTRQKMLLAAMAKAGIKAFVSKDIMDRIYQKLLVNAVINPLTAICNVRNGELPRDAGRLRLMRALHGETAAILAAAGMQAAGDEWERLLDVCRLTADNISSMLADVRGGKPTEIDALNGAVARLAGRHGLAAPLNEAVAAIVGALSGHGEER